MNLFQKYGIKEVADVVFYSINPIGDEVFYTPVLYLDTLKVSTLEKTGEKVFAEGGYGNKRLIGWNFGKEITLNLEDALFSPASMSLIWGGDLNARLSDKTSAIVKANIANKYGELNYSTKAYPSPSLVTEELDFLLRLQKIYLFDPQNENDEKILEGLKKGQSEVIITNEDGTETTVSLLATDDERAVFLKTYFDRTSEKPQLDEDGNFIKNEDGTIVTEPDIYHKAVPEQVIVMAQQELKRLSDIGYMETVIEDMEVIDRMEKCIVTSRYGFAIDTNTQLENLFRYYKDDKSSSYTIYYDPKTMLPLLRIEDDTIKGIGGSGNGDPDNASTFTLKTGTIYYKWTRTVKRKEDNTDSTLGRQFVIDAETFPDAYRIVGETYIRNQKTGKDQRYQFIIHKANVSSDTSITLEAEGDPTTFSMAIDVLVPPNDIMMELKEYDVEDDLLEGGTRIVPQKSSYTYTPAFVQAYEEKVDIDNNEIY